MLDTEIQKLLDQKYEAVIAKYDLYEHQSKKRSTTKLITDKHNNLKTK